MEETASNEPPSPERNRSRSPPPAPPIEAPDEAAAEIARRTCQVCEKVFGSAKAMWGHSWIHRERRDPPPLQGVMVGDPCQSWKIDSTEEKDRTCPGCGRVFGSPKAMFGHLHVHYQRSRAKGESSGSDQVAEPEIGLGIEINGDGGGDSPVTSIDLNRPLCMEEDEEGDGEDSSLPDLSIDLNKMPSS